MDNSITRRSSIDSATERTPLVNATGKFVQDQDPSSWSKEFKWLLKNCIPVIGTYMLQNSLQMASVFTLGRLGATQLAAAALGSMFASVSAWSIAHGMTTALDTLCSQAWTGAKDKTLVGVHLQRALVILGLMFLPIAGIWWNGERILLALNQEPELAEHAGMFLRYLMFGAPAYIAFEAVKKYLQAQGIMQASTYALIIASPINLMLNYSLVFLEPFKLGFIGAPLATSISYWIMLTLLLLYIQFVDGLAAWGGWTRECLSDWGPFLRLGLPGVIAISVEWWSFELSALAASYLSTVDLAAQSILLTSGAATYTIPYGIAVTISNRVGNALGEGAAIKATRASSMALIFAVVFGTLNSLFFILTRSWFGYLFTSEEDVVQRVSVILPICALFQISDGVAGVASGIIRGLGRQKVAAYLNVFAYYAVAAPIGYVLTFKLGMALTGLWTGLTIALFLSAGSQVIFLWIIDWHAEAKKIHHRIQIAEQKLHHEDIDSIDSTEPLLNA
ncbi:mate-domain-containing protein [Halteromyces radiatus]|uniref:mate-domain-containing protein n=1 Tax=Halteromyces radiatus TaxID=101107 RepID=UPI00221ED41F|nr:mate-domain-containing protein [Halteromyces radiatus]KAI8093384.1 mate-domain-containing protein [Halteromyces radiatus]